MFVDVSNLYYNSYKALEGKVDYIRLYEFASQFGEIDSATAYLGFRNNGFEKFLKTNKYSVKHIRAVKKNVFPSSVDIAIDVIDNLNDLTVVVSNNSSLFALYRRLYERKKKFLVLGIDNADECEDFINDNRLELPRSVLI